MAKNIPARALHETNAIGAKGANCRCRRPAEVLHHDHLINYAFTLLQFRLRRRKWKDEAISAIWQEQVHRFFGRVRFRPRWLCSLCNAGDGDGKRRDWVGVARPVYARSFSMTARELARVRATGSSHGSGARRKEAESIWSMCRRDHLRRKIEVRRMVTKIVESACSDGLIGVRLPSSV